MQGVDVWLNNPRRPLEASGTSGQKVVLNGGLNLSVLDGWWAEAYDGLNGFAIGDGRTHSNIDVHDARDGEDLYRVLREEVIPLYYERDRDGLAARLDQAHEAHHPHAGLAVQRRPHGDGLHAQVLHPGGRRHLERHAQRVGANRPYCSFSSISLITASDFCSEETERPTATLRTIEPFTPVRPACSEPMALIR